MAERKACVSEPDAARWQAMQTRTLRTSLLGAAVSALSLLCGCGPRATQSATANPKETAVAEAPVASTSDDTSIAEPDESVGPDLANAAYQVVPGDLTFPPGIRTEGSVAQVIRLAASGVDEGVILGFVTNSATLFNLSSDEIIYLNDLGVPSQVVELMLQRDQFLKQVGSNLALASAPSAPAPEMVPLPETAPVPPQQVTTPPAGLASVPPPGGTPPTDDIVPADFYDALSPYGNWVDVEGCGPCWQPAVGVLTPAWQPYLNGGHWIFTDHGWYWLSGYSWGWATFHYGRWFHHNELGWCWAPDPVWAPAWVCWRNTGTYCGWAPLPPGAGLSPAYGLVFHGRPVPAGHTFGLGASAFVFVHAGHLLDHHLTRSLITGAAARQLFDETSPMTSLVSNSGRVLNLGLAAGQISAITRSEVRQVTLRDQPAGPAGERRLENLSPGGRVLAVSRPDFNARQPRRIAPSPAPSVPAAKSIERAAGFSALPEAKASEAERFVFADATEGRTANREWRNPEPRLAALNEEPAPQVGSEAEQSVHLPKLYPLPWEKTPQNSESTDLSPDSRASGRHSREPSRTVEFRAEPPRYLPPAPENRHSEPFSVPAARPAATPPAHTERGSK